MSDIRVDDSRSAAVAGSTILELTQAMERQARSVASTTAEDPSWRRRIDGIGIVLILGDAKRFRCGTQVASYLVLAPAKYDQANKPPKFIR